MFGILEVAKAVVGDDVKRKAKKPDLVIAGADALPPMDS
jgi:hypothetical protein